MHRAMNEVSMTLDFRAVKALIGALAVVAAAAAGSGMAMTASLFGALAAVALSAGAALSALLELAASDRERVWRMVGWVALVPGWLAFAALLLHAPLAHLEGLRILATGLLAGAATLQAWRGRAQQGTSGLGVFLAAAFALVALGATWSGVLVQFAGQAVTAMGIAAALELGGTGSVWLAEASVIRSRTSIAPIAASTHAAIQMA
ncbi:MAG: hypothetical protein M3R31_01640 [Pseudomonadota bacterium]|nr:hypothetical protein [Pseudomonadota bacterium]